MVTYIGTKKIGSASDYSKLSVSEKAIASKSPEVVKILTGQPTAAQQISANAARAAAATSQLKSKILQTGSPTSGWDTAAQQAFVKEQLETWQQKYADVGEMGTANQIQTAIDTGYLPVSNAATTTGNNGWLILAGLVVAGLVLLKK